MRMLVSVRDVPEALEAARAGVDFIDLKDPAAGALGGLPLPTLCAICAALHADRGGATVGRPLISATIGDLPAHAVARIVHRVQRVAASGVDLVKVGVPGRGAAARPLLAALAGLPLAVVPVLLADEGLDADVVDAACAPAFAAVMADTEGKRAGSLLQRVAAAELRQFIAAARAAQVAVGLAGALRAADLDALAVLRPDFVGFRTAVCEGSRAGRLDPQRLNALQSQLRQLRLPDLVPG